MKNTFGNCMTVTLFGESHGECIGAVLDGVPHGITVDREAIQKELSFRSPQKDISTTRAESDEFRIVSGVFEGKTTGAPICIIIPNTDIKSADYSKNVARPSHADYTAFMRYGGYADYRGGGHLSGRLTAPLCAVGAIARGMLEARGIELETHIKSIGDVTDADFSDLEKDISVLKERRFSVLCTDAGERMQKLIKSVSDAGDSIGGVLESAVVGMPSGVGEPWFDGMESMLSHALFSIPAVKGVEFGLGFGMSALRGSEANDGMYADNGRVKTYTNNNGGINGGITNGMPITVRCAVKPTPSISKPQKTVDFVGMENTEISVKGRHDPCILPRARSVVNAMLSLTLCDLLLSRYGAEFFIGE